MKKDFILKLFLAVAMTSLAGWVAAQEAGGSGASSNSSVEQTSLARTLILNDDSQGISSVEGSNISSMVEIVSATHVYDPSARRDLSAARRGYVDPDGYYRDIRAFSREYVANHRGASNKYKQK